MDSLKEEIALNAADYAVEKWGQQLSEHKQARLRGRYYDVVIASLHSFESVANARAIRARAIAGNN